MQTDCQQSPSASPFAGIPAAPRRAARIGVEMPVRGKAGLTRSTFLLKDLTRQGARISGIGMQRVGEPITLLLPGAPRATIAFVMWANSSDAGLEFLDPLDDGLFDALIRNYAIGSRADTTPATTTSAETAQAAAIEAEAPRFAA